MGFDKLKLKQIRDLILFIALIVLALIYSEEVFAGIGLFIGIMKPFIYGSVIAFVLNVPLCFIENKLLKKWNNKFADKFKRPLCIVLSMLFVLLLITIVIVTITPQIAKTIVDLGNKIPVFIEQVIISLQQLSIDYPQIQTYVDELATVEIDWQSLSENIITFMKNGMSNVVFSTVSVAGSIIGGFINLFIGLIFAIYILSQKEKLGNQGRQILRAYLPEKANSRALKVFSLLYRNFTNFISGQCLEAVILGCMFVIAMTIFRMPYAILVGVLIAFTALIPMVGAFIGCVVGAFLIMVNSIPLAVGFVVMFLVLQQIEGNLIYPKVVGNKVGLPSIWVLMAVSVGGSLFGVAGMLFFIPLVSTMYTLLCDSVKSRNSRNRNTRSNNNTKPYRNRNRNGYYNRNNPKNNNENNNDNKDE